MALLFDAAYDILPHDARLDARLRALLPPQPPATLPAFLAAMADLHLSPTDAANEHLVQAFSAQPAATVDEEQQPHHNQPDASFAKFRRAFAYVAFAGLPDLPASPAEAVDPVQVAEAVARLGHAVEDALVRAERRLGTPKNKQTRPRRSGLLLSPTLEEEFFTPRESLRDFEKERDAHGIELPGSTADLGEGEEEEEEEVEIWYTPRPQLKSEEEDGEEEQEDVDGLIQADLSSQHVVDSKQFGSTLSPTASVPHRRDTLDSTASTSIPARLCAGVSSAAVQPVANTDAPHDLIASGSQEDHANCDALDQQPASSLSPEAPSSTQVDDQQQKAISAGEQRPEEYLEEKLPGTPSSSAATNVDAELLSDNEDQPVSDESFDDTLPGKLHAGVASAMSVWEPHSVCEELTDACGELRDDADLSERQQASVASAMQDDGDTSGAKEVENMIAGADEELAVDQATAEPSERTPGSVELTEEDEETMSNRSLIGGPPAKLQVGLTSAASPVDIKAAAEPADDTQDVEPDVMCSGNAGLSSSSTAPTSPDIMSLPDDDKENASSANKLTSKLPERPPNVLTAKADMQFEGHQEVPVTESLEAHTDSSDRRKSCTFDSSQAADNPSSATAGAGDAKMPTGCTPLPRLAEKMVHEPASLGGPGSPVLTTDPRGGWSISTCAASRDLEEEIQAGEADMPAWGHSPAGWVAPCCELGPSPESEFESPVLGSSSPMRDSTRILSFSSSEGEREDDWDSASTLSLDTRDTLGREVERYVQEMERLRARSGAGAVDSMTLEALTLDASVESELTPAGFDAVRKLSKPSCFVDDGIGSAVSTRALSGRSSGKTAGVGVDHRLEEVLRAVKESVEVCQQVRKELGWRRRDRRFDAAMWMLLVVGVGVGVCVRMLRAEAFLDALV